MTDQVHAIFDFERAAGVDFAGFTNHVLAHMADASADDFQRAMHRVRRRTIRVDDDLVMVTDGVLENIIGDWLGFPI